MVDNSTLSGNGAKCFVKFWNIDRALDNLACCIANTIAQMNFPLGDDGFMCFF
jgi:hypothetical protein